MSTKEEMNGLKQQANQGFNQEDLLKLTEMEGIEGGGDCRIACEKGCVLFMVSGGSTPIQTPDGDAPETVQP